MQIYKDYDLKPLVLAVVIHAAREANDGNEEARAWMRDESIVWLDAIGAGIQPEKIERWTRKGYKMTRSAQRLQAQPAA